jgi:hypothetical protein
MLSLFLLRLTRRLSPLLTSQRAAITATKTLADRKKKIYESQVTDNTKVGDVSVAGRA